MGFECLSGLILLGFWKKALFIINKKNALSIASSFADFKNYKFVYLNYGEIEPN